MSACEPPVLWETLNEVTFQKQPEQDQKMGHIIEYVVSLPATESNKLLESTFCTPPFGDYVEAEFSNSSLGFNVTINGHITLIALAEKYTHFTLYNDVRQRVLSWEKELRALISSAPIVRLDENLMKEWISTTSVEWYKSQELCDSFFRWIESQDRVSWAYV